ncbi:hypothetical protein [Embleya scabrispora]|uniref:hypothetical protein n=1 Tax=Embleya scabrispora TaxID=159449 RepID=UPI00131A201B|nr:hypothetical protein [Embleya scabrispora]MYS79096.1 hypothetical protein [Streptomyces sp. SID5474]
MTDQETIRRAVTSGAAVAAGPERTAIFTAVRADRDGPVTRLLLALADAGTVETRVSAIELLHSLAEFGRTWPVVAERAAVYVVDAEPGVRVAAVALFVATQDAETVSSRLPDLADPDVRVAGVTALLGRAGAFEDVLTGLLEDGDPAVRVLAALGLLGTEGVPWAWVQALDEAIAADLPTAVRRVGLGARSWGSAWAWRLGRNDHEEECHRVVRLLLAAEDAGVRWVGLDMASAAIRLWRTAPVELLPALTEVAAGGDPALRAETLRVARLSGDLWRAAVELWAADADDVGRALSDEPGAPAPIEAHVPELHAVFAARRPPGGRSDVEPWLAEQPIDVVESRRRVGRALIGLMACGGLTERQGRQAMALFESESVLKYELAGVVWRLRGAVDADIAERLVAELSAVAGDQYVGAHALPVLADMGRHAVGALPRLTALIEDRRRLPVDDGSAEAEIRFDETRRAQLVVVRDRIIADIP